MNFGVQNTGLKFEIQQFRDDNLAFLAEKFLHQTTQTKTHIKTGDAMVATTVKKKFMCDEVSSLLF